MKILGVLAVVGSCLGIGLTRIWSVRQEMLTLEALVRGIRVVRAELACRACPMTELLRCAEEQAGDSARGFFHSCVEKMDELNDRRFAALWTDACRSCLPMLSEENRSQLEQLGATLGRYELDEQIAACDRYLRGCEEEAGRLRARLPEQRRLTLALGAAAGIFLCLLIL